MATSRGRVMRQKHITRADLRAAPDTLFLFGDNMEGRGLRGQAAAMRGEPNAVGVPTKWRPGRRPEDYFRGADWRDGDVRHAIRAAFDQAEAHLSSGRTVVIPADGFGTGLAKLPLLAPRIHAHIEACIMALEALAAQEVTSPPAGAAPGVGTGARGVPTGARRPHTGLHAPENGPGGEMPAARRDWAEPPVTNPRPEAEDH